MKDKLPQLEATLEVGFGGVCMLAGGHGEGGLPPLPLPQDSRHSASPEVERRSVYGVGQAGADVISSLGSPGGLVFIGQMLKKLTLKGD